MSTTTQANAKGTRVCERVMLATLSISCWDAHCRDISATVLVERHNKASRTGQFNKRLMPSEAPEYDAVLRIMGQARKCFYEHTLAYDQLAVRVLPVKAYPQLIRDLAVHEAKFATAVNDFITAYPRLKLDAQRERENGKLFNEADYPDVTSLRGKFAWRKKFLPFPDADQYDVSLELADLAAIKAATREDCSEAVSRAEEDLKRRFVKVIDELSESLYSKAHNGRFHESRLTAALEFAQSAGSLNFKEDPIVVAFIERTKESLRTLNAQALRSSPSLCDMASRTTKSLAREMAQSWQLPLPERTPRPEKALPATMKLAPATESLFASFV